MARGHAIDKYSDGGELLGKDGKPLPTTAIRGIPALNPHGAPPAIQHMDDGELVPPPAKPEPQPAQQFEFYCDVTTWQRNMDGWTALRILDAFFAKTLGQPISVVLTEDEARNGFTVPGPDDTERTVKLPTDVRWHFRRRERKGGEDG